MTFEEWMEIHEIRHSTGQDPRNEGLILADWKDDRAKLIGALVGAAVPLEALLASVKWELAPAIVEEIAKAVREIRAVLAEVEEQK